jgi:maleate cis-trans isomerase
MIREAARTPVDAILILCTNLAGALVADPLTEELGIPVLDSVAVAVRHSLDRLEVAPLGSGIEAQSASPGHGSYRAL